MGIRRVLSISILSYNYSKGNGKKRDRDCGESEGV